MMSHIINQESAVQVQNINIFLYTHVAEYLNAVFKDVLQARPSYSIRAWARSMGLTTASLLSAVLRKERRVSEELGNKLVHYLKLNDEEKKFFAALIVFSGPRSPLEDTTVREYLGYLKEQCQTHQPHQSVSL